MMTYRVIGDDLVLDGVTVGKLLLSTETSLRDRCVSAWEAGEAEEPEPAEVDAGDLDDIDLIEEVKTRGIEARVIAGMDDDDLADALEARKAKRGR